MKKIFLLAAVVALVGCEARYRYPCQDPSNWDNEECKKPLCEINRDCPEHILSPETTKKIAPSTPVPPPPRKDCCK